MQDHPSATTLLHVEVVSDVVCPWCFIGKRRLEKATALRPDIPVEIHWRAYFLNDWVPRQGISRAEYLTRKFGSVERYGGIAERVRAAASQEGLEYHPEHISRQPNTIDCHRLIHWAGEIGKAGEMKQRLMELYFSKGADLSDPEVLVQAAAHSGLDADDTWRRLASEEDVAYVSAQAERAKQAGIDGVPCFIFGGSFAVSGAQSPEYLASAMDRAWSEQQRAASSAQV